MYGSYVLDINNMLSLLFFSQIKMCMSLTQSQAFGCCVVHVETSCQHITGSFAPSCTVHSLLMGGS